MAYMLLPYILNERPGKVYVMEDAKVGHIHLHFIFITLCINRINHLIQYHSTNNIGLEYNGPLTLILVRICIQ